MEKTGKKTLLKSLLSVAVFGIFLLIAIGSFELFILVGSGGLLYDEEEHDANTKVYTRTQKFTYGTVTTQGTKDRWTGKWHGKHIITRKSNKQKYYDYKEEVLMYQGLRVGKSKITNLYTGNVTYKCYRMGKRVDCDRSGFYNSTEVSSYEVLEDNYPWFMVTLNGFGFGDDTIKIFLDTLDIILNEHEFDWEEFDDYYSDALDILEETPQDSVIQANIILSYIQGLQEMKNSEIRFAVLDRYRLGANSTFEIIESIYPGYLSIFANEGINEIEVEEFCGDLDSCMVSYGDLDIDDPFFVDSIDFRIYRALSSLMELDESSSTEKLAVKNALILANDKKKDVTDFKNLILEQLSRNAEEIPSVSEVVLYSMLIQFELGDIIKMAVKESYLINQGITRNPTIITEISDTLPSSGIELQGFIIDDGGSDITSRGIAWATNYNPTINDNLIALETNSFTGILSGLTEGTKYYARAYTINSSDTTYGNCVSFVAMNVNEIEEVSNNNRNLKIFPNPASESASIKFNVGSPDFYSITIIDANGKELESRDLGVLPTGQQLIPINVSHLPNGFYYCQISASQVIKGKCKLIVEH